MAFPNQISITFNRNITLNSGNVKVYKNGVLYLTFTESQINVTDNVLSINVPNLFLDSGEYYILASYGLVTSSIGEVWAGISNSNEWNFTIMGAEFDETEFSNEFLI